MHLPLQRELTPPQGLSHCFVAYLRLTVDTITSWYRFGGKIVLFGNHLSYSQSLAASWVPLISQEMDNARII